jgi:type I restriction enzyme S subunit
MKSIGELVTILKGRKAPEVFDDLQPGAERYLQIDDLRPGATPKYARDAKGVLATEGDVLIAWDGANAGTVGFGLRGYAGSTIAILRPNPEEIHAPFLGYFLHSKFEYLQENCTGATIPHISRRSLEELQLTTPPLPEQKRIAAILAKADRLRRLRRYARDLSDTYLQSVFLKMFGVAESRFPIVRMQEIASKKKHALSSGPFGSNLTSKHYTDAGVIVLRGLNISTGQLDLSDVKYVSEEKAQSLARSEVRPGDVVIVAVGASGLACQIPESLPRAIMSQNFNKITPDTSKITPIYLEYCINSAIVQRQFSREITDTVRTFLSLTKLKDVEIPLPPRSLQQEFTCVVHKFERLRAQQREDERQAEHLFQTLLYRAFLGEV